MRVLTTSLICLLVLSACSKKEETTTETATAEDPHYAGIGTYEPGSGWSKIVGAPAPEDKAVATTADDDKIIIVVDTRTGEIRQCGNMSGHCVGFNPWTGPLAAEQQSPVRLTERLDDQGKTVKLLPAPLKTATETTVTTPAK